MSRNERQRMETREDSVRPNPVAPTFSTAITTISFINCPHQAEVTGLSRNERQRMETREDSVR
ncbi:MAG: hypothetical protein K9N36_07980, partial [Candidatus Marinimicrobia bacterium]|nr:hypothetical protein [Candidatus Neomarinimicrobiota bacterium]